MTIVKSQPCQTRPNARPLKQDSAPLQKKVQRRQTITAAGRDGNDKIVNQAAHAKSQNHRPTWPPFSSQGLKQEAMRQISESRIPAPAPEVRDAAANTGQFINGLALTPRYRQKQLNT